MISKYEDILKKIDEKKGKFKLQPFKGSFLYPSSDGKMSRIKSSAIKNLESMANESLKKLSWEDIQRINRSIDSGFSGEIRNHYCRIKVKDRDIAIPPSHMELKVNKLPEKFIKRCNNLDCHTIVKAALAHAELVIIHPFIDGNGRTAHLLMNFILLQGGYPITIIDNVDKYFDLLEKVEKYLKEKIIWEENIEIDFSDKSVSEFCFFISQMVEKSLDSHSKVNFN